MSSSSTDRLLYASHHRATNHRSQQQSTSSSAVAAVVLTSALCRNKTPAAAAAARRSAVGTASTAVTDSSRCVALDHLHYKRERTRMLSATGGGVAHAIITAGAVAAAVRKHTASNMADAATGEGTPNNSPSRPCRHDSSDFNEHDEAEVSVAPRTTAMAATAVVDDGAADLGESHASICCSRLAAENALLRQQLEESAELMDESRRRLLHLHSTQQKQHHQNHHDQDQEDVSGIEIDVPQSEQGSSWSWCERLLVELEAASRSSIEETAGLALFHPPSSATADPSATAGCSGSSASSAIIQYALQVASGAAAEEARCAVELEERLADEVQSLQEESETRHAEAMSAVVAAHAEEVLRLERDIALLHRYIDSHTHLKMDGEDQSASATGSSCATSAAQSASRSSSPSQQGDEIAKGAVVDAVCQTPPTATDYDVVVDGDVVADLEEDVDDVRVMLRRMRHSQIDAIARHIEQQEHERLKKMSTSSTSAAAGNEDACCQTEEVEETVGSVSATHLAMEVDEEVSSWWVGVTSALHEAAVECALWRPAVAALTRERIDQQVQHFGLVPPNQDEDQENRRPQLELELAQAEAARAEQAKRAETLEGQLREQSFVVGRCERSLHRATRHLEHLIGSAGTATACGDGGVLGAVVAPCIVAACAEAAESSHALRLLEEQLLPTAATPPPDTTDAATGFTDGGVTAAVDGGWVAAQEMAATFLQQRTTCHPNPSGGGGRDGGSTARGKFCTEGMSREALQMALRGAEDVFKRIVVGLLHHSHSVGDDDKYGHDNGQQQEQPSSSSEAAHDEPPAPLPVWPSLVEADSMRTLYECSTGLPQAIEALVEIARTFSAAARAHTPSSSLTLEQLAEEELREDDVTHEMMEHMEKKRVQVNGVIRSLQRLYFNVCRANTSSQTGDDHHPDDARRYQGQNSRRHFDVDCYAVDVPRGELQHEVRHAGRSPPNRGMGQSSRRNKMTMKREEGHREGGTLSTPPRRAAEMSLLSSPYNPMSPPPPRPSSRVSSTASSKAIVSPTADGWKRRGNMGGEVVTEEGGRPSPRELRVARAEERRVQHRHFLQYSGGGDPADPHDDDHRHYGSELDGGDIIVEGTSGVLTDQHSSDQQWDDRRSRDRGGGWMVNASGLGTHLESPPSSPW